MLIRIDIDTNGRRKILGIDLAFEESYLSYQYHFNKLKEKELKKGILTISAFVPSIIIEVKWDSDVIATRLLLSSAAKIINVKF